MTMNWIDFVIAAVVLLGVWRGFSAGFVASLASLFSWMIALLVASKIAGDLAFLFVFLTQNSVLQIAMAFVVVLLLMLVVVQAVAGVLTKSIKALKLGFVDRIIGGLLGALMGTLKVLIILGVVSPLLTQTKVVNSSIFIPSLLPYTPMAKILLYKALDVGYQKLDNPYGNYQNNSFKSSP